MKHVIRFTKIYPLNQLPPEWEFPDSVLMADSEPVEDYFFDTVEILPIVGAAMQLDRLWIVTDVQEYISTQVEWRFFEILLTMDGVLPIRSDWSNTPPVLSFELVGGKVPENNEGCQEYDLYNPVALRKDGLILFKPSNGRPIAGFDLVAIPVA